MDVEAPKSGGKPLITRPNIARRSKSVAPSGFGNTPSTELLLQAAMLQPQDLRLTQLLFRSHAWEGQNKLTEVALKLRSKLIEQNRKYRLSSKMNKCSLLMYIV